MRDTIILNVNEALKIQDALKGFTRIEAQDVEKGMTLFHIDGGLPSNSFVAEKVRAGFSGEVCITYTFDSMWDGMVTTTNHYSETHKFFILNESE